MKIKKEVLRIVLLAGTFVIIGGAITGLVLSGVFNVPSVSSNSTTTSSSNIQDSSEPDANSEISEFSEVSTENSSAEVSSTTESSNEGVSIPGSEEASSEPDPGISDPGETATASKTYYVSPSGSNNDPGTKSRPFKTIAFALDTVNKFKTEVNDDMAIILLEGNHFLTQTLEINQQYNLPDNKVLTIKADTGVKAVINAGVRITGWEKASVNSKQVYKAKVSGIKYGRSFYVNEEPMVLANSGKSDEQRLFWGWNGSDYDSIDIVGRNISGVVNAAQLEVVWHCEWKTFVKRAASIEGNSVINMRQPDFDWAITPATVAKIDYHNPNYWNWFPDPRNAKHTLFLQNDVSLIDSPGEFCYDEKTKYMYYYPKNGEDPNTKECIVSNLDTIIKINGDLGYKKVQNITFDGVVIGYGGFDLMGDHGMATLQNQHYFSDVTTLQGIPDNYYKGNIIVEAAKNINFLNCGIINTDKSIHFNTGVEGASVIGCYFKNLGDSAVVIGNGWCAYERGAAITKDIVVKNNLIRRIGLVNQSVPAINAFFSRNSTISHNDIYDVPYTGISVGWGWYVCLDSDYSQNNVIEYNKVGKYMQTVRDGGGIYTLGQQPGSVVRYNYLFDQGAAYGGIYHDEGSSGYLTEYNVIDNNTNLNDPNQTWLCLNGFAVKPGSSLRTVYGITIRNNYTTNPRITNNGDSTIKLTLPVMLGTDNNAWPQEAKNIVNGSGLESSYKYLLNK